MSLCFNVCYMINSFTCNCATFFNAKVDIRPIMCMVMSENKIAISAVYMHYIQSANKQAQLREFYGIEVLLQF